MTPYRLAVGTHDPQDIAAASDAEAVGMAIDAIAAHYGADRAANPQEVVTVLGPDGLVTRSGERLDEFMQRRPDAGSATQDSLQPGDTNAPDCNGD